LNSLQEYENACKNTVKRKQAADKLKSASQLKHEKVDVAIAELTEAKNDEEECKDFLRKISDSLREHEWPHVQSRRESMMLRSLLAHTGKVIQLERQMWQNWSEGISNVSDSNGVANTFRSSVAEKIAAEVL
jgi:hypothetical protein